MEVYLLVTKIGLNSPILRLLKRQLECQNIVMSRENERAKLNYCGKGRSRKGLNLEDKSLHTPILVSFVERDHKFNM